MKNKGGVRIAGVRWGQRRTERGEPLRRQRYLFDPMLRMAEAGGPMKRTPLAAQSSANSAFSDRKP